MESGTSLGAATPKRRHELGFRLGLDGSTTVAPTGPDTKTPRMGVPSTDFRVQTLHAGLANALTGVVMSGL